MMVEAKCCNCGTVLKAEKPHGIIRQIIQCGCCGTKQFIEQVPGMEFFAAIPLTAFWQDNNNKDFVSIGAAIGAVVAQKQKQYGSAVSSAGPILKELYPDGIKPEQYNDLALIVRILDKISRITKGNGEGGEDSWSDIAGYAILGKANVQNR